MAKRKMDDTGWVLATALSAATRNNGIAVAYQAKNGRWYIAIDMEQFGGDGLMPIAEFVDGPPPKGSEVFEGCKNFVPLTGDKDDPDEGNVIGDSNAEWGREA